MGGSRLGEFDDIEGPVMNLQDLENNGNRQDFLRQNDPNEGAIEPADDDAIRCIPKVMQVEETVYDRAIKCHHSYQEKCHMTYITDYRSTSEKMRDYLQEKLSNYLQTHALQ